MSSSNVDLKQTLNLPRTNFSMKANLPQAEPKMLARWAAEDLYGEIAGGAPAAAGAGRG